MLEYKEPKAGEYYSTRTLIGGDPDCNERRIYRWPSDKKLITIWPSGVDLAWTRDDQWRLTVILEALNAKNE